LHGARARCEVARLFGRSGLIERRMFGRGAAALATVALASPSRAQSPPELRLGALFPLSGPLAPVGDEAFRGVELAIEERNAGGGVLGRAIRLVRADATDEATAVGEARRLSNGTERVAALLGGFSTAVALPASQVAEAAGVPWLDLGTVADGMADRGFRWVFRASPPASEFAAVALDGVTQVLSPLLNVAADRLKVAIAHEDAPGGNSIAAAQEALGHARGLHLVERANYAPRSPDLNTVVQRLRGQGAEIVLHTGAPGDELLLFRAMRDAGWTPRMVIGAAGGYGLRETARSLGDAVLGTMSADWTPFAVSERYAPGARAFAEAYLRRYGAEPRSGHGLASFVGARIFLEALHRAGGTEKERLRPAVLALDIAEATTATGWGARFDERGQNLRARPVLCQWQRVRDAIAQVAVHPAGAAVADAVGRLGG
jgi:branched-chain amino acid transport system substrate-binding protein